MKVEYISHTKGHYGSKSLNKKFKKKGMQEDSYAKNKSPKAQKSAKWHGNEEQMNISIYHML